MFALFKAEKKMLFFFLCLHIHVSLLCYLIIINSFFLCVCTYARARTRINKIAFVVKGMTNFLKVFLQVRISWIISKFVLGCSLFFENYFFSKRNIKKVYRIYSPILMEFLRCSFVTSFPSYYRVSLRVKYRRSLDALGMRYALSLDSL